MSQLDKLRELLGNPDDSDAILQFCLDRAKDIICDIRNSDKVEEKYLNTQLSIAIEIYNKRGAEGQLVHNETGIDRTYSSADISPEIIRTITPVVKTPFSKVRKV
mgnify:CR=1 FL=1